MKSKFAKIILIVFIIITCLIIAFFLIIREAFGPKHRTVKIQIDNNTILICEETYNGDFAGEFYDIDLFLKSDNHETINIGSTTFYDANWEDNFPKYRMGKWLVLPFDDNYCKIIFVNLNTYQILKIQVRFGLLHIPNPFHLLNHQNQ